MPDTFHTVLYFLSHLSGTRIDEEELLSLLFLLMKDKGMGIR